MAPIIDTVFAVGWSALTIAAAADAARGCPPNQLCFSSLAAGSAVVTGVFAVATGVSASYGYSKTSRCRDATACTRGDRAACEKLDWALRPPDDAVRRALERDGDLIPPPDPREPSPDFR